MSQIDIEKGWCIADTDSKVQRFERWPFVRELCMFLSDEGPTLETLDFTIRIGNTPTFFYADLYLINLFD